MLDQISGWIINQPLGAFLAIMMAISLLPFALAYRLKIDLFESAKGLALLLLIVWSPNIAAVVVHSCMGTLAPWLSEALALPSSYVPWLLASLPLGVLAATYSATRLSAKEQPNPEPLDIRSILLLVVINLVLGPTGEELGFRGFLVPQFLGEYSFVWTASAIGVIWALWHAPLWLVDSPQAKIPFAIFMATVICFSIILTKIYMLSDGSIWPAVLFHFLANVSVGWVEATGRFAENKSYPLLLPGYAIAAATVLAL